MSCSSTSIWVVFVAVPYCSTLLVSPHLLRAACTIFVFLPLQKISMGLVVKDTAFVQGARVGCAVCSGFRTSVDGTVFLITGEEKFKVSKSKLLKFIMSTKARNGLTVSCVAWKEGDERCVIAGVLAVVFFYCNIGCVQLDASGGVPVLEFAVKACFTGLKT